MLIHLFLSTTSPTDCSVIFISLYHPHYTLALFHDNLDSVGGRIRVGVGQCFGASIAAKMSFDKLLSAFK